LLADLKRSIRRWCEHSISLLRFGATLKRRQRAVGVNYALLPSKTLQWEEANQTFDESLVKC
jgi:hypothetical protein